MNNWIQSNPQRAAVWGGWGNGVRGNFYVGRTPFFGGNPFYTQNFWSGRNLIGLGLGGAGYGRLGAGIGGYPMWWGYSPWSGYRPWNYWWGVPTWNGLTGWFPNYGWNQPYYWDYGPGEYIYCNNGVVYVNGAWYEPAPVFYQQTVQLIDQAPVLTQQVAAQAEWLPLGVFAVTPDGVKDPNMMAQLAVTKDGVIGGTLFDEVASKSYPIQGTVDKNTQRAVWSFTNDQNVRVLMETSVNNLTQNESTGLVHFGPNEQKVVEFVRLQDPSSDQPGEQLPAPPLGAVQQGVAKPLQLTPPQAP